MILLALMMETSLILGGASYHVGARDYTYKGETRSINEFNPTIGVEIDGWQVAVTKNSFYKTSVLQSHTWYWRDDNWVQGIKAGLATGYGDTKEEKDILPFGQFEVGYQYRDVTTVVGYIPNTNGGVFTLHWKVAF